MFCVDCIKEWAFKIENTCPNCKESFDKIITKTEEIKVPEKIELNDDDSEFVHFCDFCLNVINLDS